MGPFPKCWCTKRAPTLLDYFGQCGRLGIDNVFCCRILCVFILLALELYPVFWCKILYVVVLSAVVVLYPVFQCLVLSIFFGHGFRSCILDQGFVWNFLLLWNYFFFQLRYKILCFGVGCCLDFPCYGNKSYVLVLYIMRTTISFGIISCTLCPVLFVLLLAVRLEPVLCASCYNISLCHWIRS